MTAEKTNALTVVVFLGPWVLWLAWEVFLLLRRARDVRVKTISMVAKERGPHLSALVYLHAGMASHWWWPSAHFAPTWAGIWFWMMLAPLLAHDVLKWRSEPKDWPAWERWAFNPLTVLALGFVAGRVLFPQVG